MSGKPIAGRDGRGAGLRSQRNPKARARRRHLQRRRDDRAPAHDRRDAIAKALAPEPATRRQARRSTTRSTAASARATATSRSARSSLLSDGEDVGSTRSARRLVERRHATTRFVCSRSGSSRTTFNARTLAGARGGDGRHLCRGHSREGARTALRRARLQLSNEYLVRYRSLAGPNTRRDRRVASRVTRRHDARPTRRRRSVSRGRRSVDSWDRFIALVRSRSPDRRSASCSSRYAVFKLLSLRRRSVPQPDGLVRRAWPTSTTSSDTAARRGEARALLRTPTARSAQRLLARGSQTTSSSPRSRCRRSRIVVLRPSSALRARHCRRCRHRHADRPAGRRSSCPIVPIWFATSTVERKRRRLRRPAAGQPRRARVVASRGPQLRRRTVGRRRRAPRSRRRASSSASISDEQLGVPLEDALGSCVDAHGQPRPRAGRARRAAAARRRRQRRRGDRPGGRQRPRPRRSYAGWSRTLTAQGRMARWILTAAARSSSSSGST